MLAEDRKIRDFINDHEVTVVIENNADGQLHGILKLETDVPDHQLVSSRRCNGLALSARWITEQITTITQR